MASANLRRSMTDKINIAGIVRESIVDGPGYRFCIFVQGCPHHCEGCHNPKTHDFNGGKTVSVERLFEEIKKGRLLRGVTFSGGEPFCQPEALCELARLIKTTDLDIIVYSGYTFEELLEMSCNNPKIFELLSLCDYLIDGRFILKERSLSLRWRGSKNQRIIDLKTSLPKRTAVLADI